MGRLLVPALHQLARLGERSEVGMTEPEQMTLDMQGALAQHLQLEAELADAADEPPPLRGRPRTPRAADAEPADFSGHALTPKERGQYLAWKADKDARQRRTRARGFTLEKGWMD
jgi:hypothetical protein